MAFGQARVTPGNGESAENSGSFAKIKGIIAVTFSRATVWVLKIMKDNWSYDPIIRVACFLPQGQKTKSNQIWINAEVKRNESRIFNKLFFPKTYKIPLNKKIRNTRSAGQTFRNSFTSGLPFGQFFQPVKVESHEE